MAVDGAAHREKKDDDEAAERAALQRHAVLAHEGGNEVPHHVGERGRRHREERHLPAHVGKVAEEGREFVPVVAEGKTRLNERGKARADAADGENAHERAGEEVANHAGKHGLPDRKAEPEHVDAERNAENGNVPREPDREKVKGAPVAFAVGYRIDAVGFNAGCVRHSLLCFRGLKKNGFLI